MGPECGLGFRLDMAEKRPVHFQAPLEILRSCHLEKRVLPRDGEVPAEAKEEVQTAVLVRTSLSTQSPQNMR